MTYLLRPLAAIMAFTIGYLIISTLAAFLDNGEAVAQPSSSFVNYSGQVVTFFQPDEYPTIINDTEALEVVELTKSLDHCQLLLRNKSIKNIVAYCLSVRKHDIEIDGGYGHRRTLIAPGETYQEEHLKNDDLAYSDLKIRVIVFDDDSFEGDLNLAAKIVARREGIRIQSAPLLQMIARTLATDDANLSRAFDELETQLGVMPEAIDKGAALELLRTKYPCFDKRMIGSLYEYLKIGLYEGKNMAHSPVGNVQRYIKRQKTGAIINQDAVDVNLIREKLNEIKKNFEGYR